MSVAVHAGRTRDHTLATLTGDGRALADVGKSLAVAAAGTAVSGIGLQVSFPRTVRNVSPGGRTEPRRSSPTVTVTRTRASGHAPIPRKGVQHSLCYS